MGRKEMARVWDEHNAAEFAIKDADTAMKTMVENPSVRIMAHGGGGQGAQQVRDFYRDVFIPHWPDDAQLTPVSRTVGDDEIVDELHLEFTHAKQMDWLLPGVAPTNRKVVLDLVIVVPFQNDLVAAERIYWDHASVLRQVGLLES
jgi:carboxymethylenebutenolidase